MSICRNGSSRVAADSRLDDHSLQVSFFEFSIIIFTVRNISAW